MIKREKRDELHIEQSKSSMLSKLLGFFQSIALFGYVHTRLQHPAVFDF